MDSTDALSRFRCRERRLNKVMHSMSGVPHGRSSRQAPCRQTDRQTNKQTDRQRADRHCYGLQNITCHAHFVILNLAIDNIDGLQHKGTMSRKPVCDKIAKIPRSCVPLCGRMTSVHVLWLLLTKLQRYQGRVCRCVDVWPLSMYCDYYWQKSTIFCNDIMVSKASTSIELLAINILLHVIKK